MIIGFTPTVKIMMERTVIPGMSGDPSCKDGNPGEEPASHRRRIDVLPREQMKPLYDWDCEELGELQMP